MRPRCLKGRFGVLLPITHHFYAPDDFRCIYVDIMIVFRVRSYIIGKFKLNSPALLALLDLYLHWTSAEMSVFDFTASV